MGIHTAGVHPQAAQPCWGGVRSGRALSLGGGSGESE